MGSAHSNEAVTMVMLGARLAARALEPSSMTLTGNDGAIG